MVWLSWLCRITPSLTTATIRSSGWTPFDAGACEPSNEAGCALVAGGALGLSSCAEAGRASAAAANVRTRLARCNGFIFVMGAGVRMAACRTDCPGGRWLGQHELPESWIWVAKV